MRRTRPVFSECAHIRSSSQLTTSSPSIKQRQTLAAAAGDPILVRKLNLDAPSRAAGETEAASRAAGELGAASGLRGAGGVVSRPARAATRVVGTHHRDSDRPRPCPGRLAHVPMPPEPVDISASATSCRARTLEDRPPPDLSGALARNARLATALGDVRRLAPASTRAERTLKSTRRDDSAASSGHARNSVPLLCRPTGADALAAGGIAHGRSSSEAQ